MIMTNLGQSEKRRQSTKRQHIRDLIPSNADNQKITNQRFANDEFREETKNGDMVSRDTRQNIGCLWIGRDTFDAFKCVAVANFLR